MKRLVFLLPFVFATFAIAAEDATYRKSCSICHGADGGGGTPAGKAMKVRDLRTAEVQEQSDDALAAVIAEGKGKMPGFKSSLSPEQIRELVSFLRTLAKKPQ